jgi:hypothetical protein
MFCPVCKAEYRRGYTRCSDCNVMLVHRLAADPPSRSEDHAELVLLRTYPTDAEASIAKSVLEAAGIESVIRGPDQAFIRGTDLFVSSCDADEATKILRQATESI